LVVFLLLVCCRKIWQPCQKYLTGPGNNETTFEVAIMPAMKMGGYSKLDLGKIRAPAQKAKEAWNQGDQMRLGKKIAQNVAQPIFCSNLFVPISVDKVAPKCDVNL
jgi:hypothetical protein